MSNRIVKDFTDWNLITEMNDMVGSTQVLGTGVVGSGNAGATNFSSAGTEKEAAGTAGTAGRSGAGAGLGAADSTTSTTTAAPASPAALDKLATDSADMIVALFAKTRAFWSGENDLKLKATGWNDTEEDGDKIFKDYWTKYILPKINMIPAGNKNKITLTDLQALISKSILAGGAKNFTFQIVTTSTGRPVAKSYTINTDY